VKTVRYMMWITVLLMGLWLVGCTSTGTSYTRTVPLFEPGVVYSPDDVLCVNSRGGLYFASINP